MNIGIRQDGKTEIATMTHPHSIAAKGTSSLKNEHNEGVDHPEADKFKSPLDVSILYLLDKGYGERFGQRGSKINIKSPPVFPL